MKGVSEMRLLARALPTIAFLVFIYLMAQLLFNGG